ncbi:MAG TPA: hypothetical protein PKH07_05190 [bacterium]|nr:hypothetical protein [bacterium]
MRSILIPTLLVLLICVGVSAHAQGQAVGDAKITSVSGTVIVRSASSSKLTPAKPAMVVSVGDTVMTRKASEATLLFQKTGAFKKLGSDENYVVQVEQQDSATKSGLGDVLSGLTELFTSQSDTREELLAISATVRKATDESGVVKNNYIFRMPLNTDLLEETPTIRWNPIQDARAYSVSIADPTGVFLEKSTMETALDLAALNKPLARNVTYTVKVRASVPDKGIVEDSGYIRVKSVQEVSQIKQAEQMIHDETGKGLDETSSALILGRYLESSRLYQPAYQLYEQMLKKDSSADFAKLRMEIIEVTCQVKEPTVESN